MRLHPAIILALTAATLLAADPASRPATQPGNSETFTSAQFQFELQYPDDWTVLDKPVNNQVFSMQTEPAKAADKNLGVMGLRIDAGPQTASDEQILKDVSGGLVNYIVNHGGKHASIKLDKLGDIPARRIRFDTEQPAGTTTALYIVGVHKRKEFVFAIAAPAEQIEKMLPKVETVLKSFKLLE